MNPDADSAGSDASPQAAAIPFRRADAGIEVCLIRKKGSAKGWGIPKGVVDPGDTLEGTALNETEEEAGLGGRLVGRAIGHYEYEKWDTVLTVAVYLLEVLEEHASWDEDHFRERRWWPLDEAIALLARHPVQPLLGRVTRALTSRQQGD